MGAILLLVGGVILCSLALVALVAFFAFAVILFACSFGLFLMAFWIWMLIDCIRNGRISENEKIIWVLVIVFTHFLGALIYFFAGRKRAQTTAVGG